MSDRISHFQLYRIILYQDMKIRNGGVGSGVGLIRDNRETAFVKFVGLYPRLRLKYNAHNKSMMRQ